jgi:flagellar protein FlgJ
MEGPAPSRSPGSLAAALAARTPEARRAREAARDFEALLLGQLLRTIRSSGAVGGALFTGQGQRIYREMMDDEMGRALAGAGGLGLADLIARDLMRRLPAANDRSSPATTVPMDTWGIPREEATR